jgi:hypothetical protein
MGDRNRDKWRHKEAKMCKKPTNGNGKILFKNNRKSEGEWNSVIH